MIFFLSNICGTSIEFVWPKKYLKNSNGIRQWIKHGQIKKSNKMMMSFCNNLELFPHLCFLHKGECLTEFFLSSLCQIHGSRSKQGKKEKQVWEEGLREYLP